MFRSLPLLLSEIGLTLGTALVVLYTASEEPFFAFDAAEFAMVVMLGGALALLWLLWGWAMLRSAKKPWQIAWAVGSAPLLLASLGWLAFSVHGYFEDLRHFTGTSTPAWSRVGARAP